MRETHVVEIGGLRTIVVGAPSSLAVVLLHGRQMQATDLAPFTHSLGTHARFYVPDAPLAAAPSGRSWWPVDAEARARARAVSCGPLDLSAMDPPGRVEARALLSALIAHALTDGANGVNGTNGTNGPTRVVVVGFSQGGMLAMDHALCAPAPERPPHALALLSSTRIAIDDWTPRLSRLRGMPVLVAHGRADAELAFSAGEALAEAARAGGADVTFLPFDGPHEIPLVVWRALRKFLRALGG
jgi:phospholipase/carboxylesterase